MSCPFCTFGRPMFEELITEPAIEPVSVAEQAAFSKIDEPVASPPSAEYLQLLGFIAAARSIVEDKTGRALITQEWRMTLDSFPGPHTTRFNQWVNSLQHIPYPEPIQLWHTPVQTGDTSPPINPVIKYIDPAGEEQTFSAVNYTVADGKIFLKVNQFWPQTACVQNAVTVTYTAGYSGDPADVPQRLKLATMYLAEQFRQNPNMVAVEPTSEVAFTFCALLSGYINIVFPRARQ